MENNTNTTPNQEENILDSLKEKAAELKEIAGNTLEEIQEKAGDLLEQAKSSDFLDDAKDKMSDLVEEAKGIWNKVMGSEETAIEATEEAKEGVQEEVEELSKMADNKIDTSAS
jgi:methyl-accepting chemotaxis protein